MNEHVVVVCSAALRDALPLREPADLRRATLLQLATRPHAFDEWARLVGAGTVDARRGVRFEHHEMVLQAAIAGLGVAVLPVFVCERELADGRVVEPFAGTRVATGKGYWLAYPERRAELPALRAFRAWLLREHGRDPG
jgi:LysR family transcriptional regulator, glycine cleavage system transcriptional activator